MTAKRQKLLARAVAACFLVITAGGVFATITMAIAGQYTIAFLAAVLSAPCALGALRFGFPAPGGVPTTKKRAQQVTERDDLIVDGQLWPVSWISVRDTQYTFHTKQGEVCAYHGDWVEVLAS